MIIIEGSDLAGKSTFIDEFLKFPFINKNFKKFNFFNIKKRYPDTWLEHIDYCGEIEYNCLKQCQDKKYILDRFYISSIIYNQVFNRKYDTSYINPNDFLNCLTIYISIEDKILLERIKKRNEDEKIINKLLDLNFAFENYFKNATEKYLRIDGNEDPIKNSKYIIETIINL